MEEQLDYRLKIEIRNWGEMKRVYELDVYQLAEELSDMIWYDFDKWNKKVQNTGFSNKKFQITKHKLQINHNDRNSKF
jgi:hypothetical protein